MHIAFSLAIILSIPAFSFAAHPGRSAYKETCWDGQCMADTAEYAMTVKGPKATISDVAGVSGWIVMDCNRRDTSQKIRIVCKDDEASSGCKYLEAGKNPVNKIIRVPRKCGRDPFVRVVNVAVAKDQNLPAGAREKLSNKDKPSKVYALEFDIAFDKVPKSMGPVVFGFVSTMAPEEQEDTDSTELDRRATKGNRSLIGSIIGEHGLVWKVTAIHRFIASIWTGNSSTTDVVKSLANGIDTNVTFSQHLIEHRSEIPLIKPGDTCKKPLGELVEMSATGALKLSVKTDISLLLSGGVAMKGQLVPPKLEKFRFFNKINGTIKGSIQLAASVFGLLDTKDRIVLELVLPVFGIPSLLNMGPKFQLVLRGRALLDLTFYQEIGFHYLINDLRMHISNSDELQNSGTIEALDAPLILNVDPSATAKADLSFHVMPRLAFGATVMGEHADLFAEMDFGLHGGVSLTAKELGRTTSRRSGEHDRFSEIALRASEPAAGGWDLVKDFNLQGCAYVFVQFAINIGAYASFLGWIDNHPSRKLELFKRQHSLYKVCTGGASAQAKVVKDFETPVISEAFQGNSSVVPRVSKRSALIDETYMLYSRADATGGFTCKTSLANGTLYSVYKALTKPRPLPGGATP
ncbi:hypothetical protein HGRIS_014349 [Hohenbuehelia grisea]|uniref:Uncharacterized protein n=1 Tax=Hohenbuehelia grisea TaxID=104357 RepID=A0ABR3JTZ4_9AGAR